PEIGKGVIALDDADSVVKGARLFYEDGALARAVELLQYAIERRPTEIKAWLALFEIFRLERLTGEFAQLAVRFREQHGKSDYWPKVQYFGREIDPGNPLYATPAIDNFQTIGPAQARRIAAADAIDPVAENWLGAPMDFQNEVLANELRKTLMADAGINEQDLVPNPMPALRNVEMFSVAAATTTKKSAAERVLQLKTVREAPSRAAFLGAVRELGKDGGEFTLERLLELMRIEEHFQALLLYDQIDFLRQGGAPTEADRDFALNVQRICL